jgi:hypothetical protein
MPRAYKMFARIKQNNREMLHSYVTLHRFSLKYSKRRINRPILKDSLLFVFENLRAAKNFRDNEGISVECYPIWEVEVPKLFPLESMVEVLYIDNLAKDFWNGQISWSDVSPEGTKGATQVKLIKKVA